MFGNLKNKLGEVADLKKYTAPQLLNSLTGSRQRSSQHTPGAHTPSLPKHSRQPSDGSLSGAGGTSLTHSIVLEQNESFQCDEEKHNETVEREAEKLKSALESQQHSALQKLNAKELEWRNRLEQQEKKLLSLEEELRNVKNREEELTKRLTEKERENAASNNSVVKKDDVEKRLIDLQEHYDQLEGLSTQEVAKVKHLLLNASSELEKSQDEINEKSNEIESLTKRVSSLEAMEERVHVMSEEKMDLETTVAGLNHKLNAVNMRHQKELEEQQEEVKHLNERIALLGERQAQDTMEDDEKNTALFKEREKYEHRLDEARQQLNNIKSSWSEKISALEDQIQHLNKKIAEDQEDLNSYEASNISLKKQLEEMGEQKKLAEDHHSSEVKSLQQDIENLKEDVESSKWQLETETGQKNTEVKELRRTLHIQEEKCHQLSEELNSLKKDKERLNETVKELQSYSDELKSNNSTLEGKYASLQNSNATLQEHFTRERESADAIGKELQTIKEKYEVVCTERTKLSFNLDKYLEKVNEYDVTTKTLESEKVTLAARIEILERELQSSREKREEMERTIRELETDFEGKVERSALVQELREKLRRSDDEVSEKKQMLKVQSQRLADMKKTIQRELKINPDSTDLITDSSEVNQFRARLSSDQQKLLVSPSQSKIRKKSTESQNGDIEFDPVNLEYLKHVVLKFITSREYEAVQLTRAVATLLHMSPEEENLLRETLEWKMSWFGSRPNIGKGQLAKGIPPQ